MTVFTQQETAMVADLVKKQFQDATRSLGQVKKDSAPGVYESRMEEALAWARIWQKVTGNENRVAPANVKH